MSRVLLALKAGQFNIGGERQIYMGGLGSALIGLSIQGLSAIVHVLLALLGGFLLGALWGFIPGYLKAIQGVNEVITTLLLNYIAQYLVSYLVSFCHPFGLSGGSRWPEPDRGPLCWIVCSPHHYDCDGLIRRIGRLGRSRRSYGAEVSPI